MSAKEILSYAPPPRIANTPADVARRAILWTVLCGISAAPSFIWAGRFYDRSAMLCGVMLFIVLYTWTTSTQAFLRFREKPFVRRTLYIGYATRIGLSIAFPLGMAVDLLPGLFSVQVVATITGAAGPGGFGSSSFVETFLITLVQGSILNCLLTVYMVVIWGVQRIFGKVPTETRGFPVEVNQSVARPRQ